MCRYSTSIVDRLDLISLLPPNQPRLTVDLIMGSGELSYSLRQREQANIELSSSSQHVYLTNLQNPSNQQKLAIRGAILDVCWAPDSNTMAYVGGLGKEVRSQVSSLFAHLSLQTRADQRVRFAVSTLTHKRVN